jgi:hypothetical protein
MPIVLRHPTRNPRNEITHPERMASCKLSFRGTSIASTERGKSEEFGGLGSGGGFVVNIFWWPTFKLCLLSRRFVFFPILLTGWEAPPTPTPGSAITTVGKRAKEREAMQMKDLHIIAAETACGTNNSKACVLVHLDDDLAQHNLDTTDGGKRSTVLCPLHPSQKVGSKKVKTNKKQKTPSRPSIAST